MAWNPDHYKLQTDKTVGSSAGGFTVNHIKKRKLMKKDSNVMDSKRVFIILSILLLITWLTMEETEAQFEGPIGKKRRRRRCRLKRRCSRKRRHRNDAGTQRKQGLANQKLSWTNQLTTYALHLIRRSQLGFFFLFKQKGGFAGNSFSFLQFLVIDLSCMSIFSLWMLIEDLETSQNVRVLLTIRSFYLSPA